MQFINGLLMSVTFFASVTLLVILQQRKLVGRLLLFFVLLVFYVLRSAVLLFGMRAFDRAAYLEIEFFTSLVDLGLQLALAYFLIRSLTRLQHRGPVRLQNSAWFLFGATLLVAGALTAALGFILPVYSPVPVDREVVLSGLVFLLLVFVRNRDKSSPEAAVLTGFWVVSAVNILAQFGRTIAASHRDPRLFISWAYANSAMWVCVLVFWILRLASIGKVPDFSGLAASRAESEPNPL